MMTQGLLEEAKSLLAYRKLRPLHTVGYSELFNHLAGETDLGEAVEQIKMHSRRYAKRQMTWFRNQGEWQHFHPDEKERIFNHIQLQMNDLDVEE